MLRTITPLPVEIYIMVADHLESFAEFINFKKAFGISNSMTYSGKHSGNIRKDFAFLLNCKKERQIVEKTVLRMFRNCKITNFGIKPAEVFKLAEMDFVAAMEHYFLTTTVKPTIKYFQYCFSRDAFIVLLKNGFSTDLRDKAGNTFLHQCNNPDVAEIFLNWGASPAATNISLQTPLHTCSSAEVAELLLKAGANVDAVDKDGKTPMLEHANEFEILSVLLRFSSNIDAVDLNGKSILHLTQDADVVELICARNCNVNSRDFLGRTPLSCHGRRKDLKKILLSYGARLSNLELLGFPFDMINAVGGKAFSFKSILDHKILGDPRFRQRFEYLVDWKDHLPTWEPSNMFKTMEMINRYWGNSKKTIPKEYEKAVASISENGQQLDPDDFLAFRMESLDVQIG